MGVRVIIPRIYSYKSLEERKLALLKNSKIKVIEI